MRPALACALLLSACAADAQGEVSIASGDATTYGQDVHPFAEVTCATLDCHGDPSRPLRLYAETGLRLRAELRLADLPITVEELAHNAEALVAIDPDPPSIDAHVALTKPLAVREGGLHHVGADLWPSRGHPAYRCLRAWLEGGRDPDACASAASAATR